jgi:hypothetical protein
MLLKQQFSGSQSTLLSNAVVFSGVRKYEFEIVTALPRRFWAKRVKLHALAEATGQNADTQKTLIIPCTEKMHKRVISRGLELRLVVYEIYTL